MSNQRLDIRIQNSKFKIQNSAIRNPQSTIHNEHGIALVMVMILSTIALAVMAGLIYMVTSGTQISGMQKRYSTAFEAGLGGIDVTYQVILLRGDATNTASFLSTLTNGTGTTPASCVTLSSDSSCTAIGSYTGIATKLNLPTSCWSGCDSSMTINTATSTSYDIRFDLGSYRVYTKIVDTVVGNSGGDEGLIKGGVVTSNTGEITVMSVPYLYTIEVDSENPNNPAERAKLSILYQY